MIDQRTLDEVADLLVQDGKRVTYDHLREAFAARNNPNGPGGGSHSDRDIQDPFADWKRRRRYRPHLAALDLDGRTERALAQFLALARSASAGTPDREDGEEMVTRAQVALLAERIEGAITAAAEERAALRADIASLASAVEALAGERTKGRKSGIVASTSLHFWDQLMRAFAAEIRRRGPLTAEELLATVTKDALRFAERNFERITLGVVTDKLQTRDRYNKYIRPVADGRYDLIERRRVSKRQLEGSV